MAARAGAATPRGWECCAIPALNAHGDSGAARPRPLQAHNPVRQFAARPPKCRRHLGGGRSSHAISATSPHNMCRLPPSRRARLQRGWPVNSRGRPEEHALPPQSRAQPQKNESKLRVHTSRSPSMRRALALVAHERHGDGAGLCIEAPTVALPPIAMPEARRTRREDRSMSKRKAHAKEDATWRQKESHACAKESPKDGGWKNTPHSDWRLLVEREVSKLLTPLRARRPKRPALPSTASHMTSRRGARGGGGHLDPPRGSPREAAAPSGPSGRTRATRSAAAPRRAIASSKGSGEAPEGAPWREMARDGPWSQDATHNPVCACAPARMHNSKAHHTSHHKSRCVRLPYVVPRYNTLRYTTPHHNA